MHAESAQTCMHLDNATGGEPLSKKVVFILENTIFSFVICIYFYACTVAEVANQLLHMPNQLSMEIARMNN